MSDFSVGERIKSLRIERGYSVKELAEMIGVSTKFIYNIEAGQTGFSSGILLKLSDALQVDCEFIMTGKKNSDIEKIIQAVKKLDAKEQKLLEIILSEIIKMKQTHEE